MHSQPQNPFRMRTLIPFLLISFGLAWGILAMYIVGGDTVADLFGALTGSHPLFYLAVYAPAIAACVVVLRHAGYAGLRSFLSRLLIWRCPLRWWLFVLVIVPLPFLVAAAIQGTLYDTLPGESWTALAGAMVLMAIKGPVEEIGWRGFMQPMLQRAMAPLWAGILLGVVWGVWHYPAFLLSGTPQSAWSFSAFFAGVIALSVLATALFNHTRGSILLAALFHFQMTNPIWPDAQPLDTVCFVALAILVTVWNRKAMLTRSGAVTAILAPQDKEPIDE